MATPASHLGCSQQQASGMTIEVEAKFPVLDLNQLLADATALGFQFPHNPVLEQDEYFNHPSRDFRETDEALRIRRLGCELILTWKGPRLDSLSKSRRELEAPFDVPADHIDTRLKALTEILLALGFTRSGSVRKLRRSATIAFEGAPSTAALMTSADCRCTQNWKHWPRKNSDTKHCSPCCGWPNA